VEHSFHRSDLRAFWRAFVLATAAYATFKAFRFSNLTILHISEAAIFGVTTFAGAFVQSRALQPL
jgi:hypothetical protein